MTKTLGRGPTQSQRTLIIVAVVALFASLVTINMPTPAQADSHTPNQAGYWEDLYPEASECIKYGATGSNQHGSSDGTAVTLSAGFEFVVLIVKGGSVDHGYGPGNAVYEDPVPGTAYHPPTNAGGQLAQVSHWIICIGEEEPDEAAVDVRGECVEEDFVITITAHNSTVDIDLDGDGLLETGETDLGSGDYEFTGDDENWIPWEATAADGAEFDDGKTTRSGEIYIEECEEDFLASVSVTGQCVEDEFHVAVTTEHASVSIDLNGDGDFDDPGESGLTGGSHVVTAEAGDTIDWHAVADEDAEFDEDIDELEGEITVADCRPDLASVSVGGECVEDDFIITIDAQNATVDIDLDGDGELESGEMDLGSGDYEFTGDDENWIPWEASATDGAEFDDGKSTKSGEIYIEECEEDFVASVRVTGECVEDDFVVMISAEHASVSIDLNGDGDFDDAGESGLTGGSHMVTAGAGDTIDWHAVADEDAEFDEDIDELEGEIEVDECGEVLASIVVTVSGTCVLNGDDGQGVITVTIPVDGAATVVVTDEDDKELATLTKSGTVNVPEGASYSWEAEANEGFEFPPGFNDSGEIDIVECSEPEVQASVLVTVTGACFVVGSDGQGRITVEMSVDGAATVVITDEDDKAIATLTKPGTVTVEEGASYSWEAEANEGFEFPAGFTPEGDVVIATCSAPEELPFTGVESEPLVAIAATLLGLGAVLVMSTGRREEF